MGTLVELLKFSGPISLPELRDRTWEEPQILGQTLAGLVREGLVVVRGPLSHKVEVAFEAEHSEDAAKTTVELSSRGLQSIML